MSSVTLKIIMLLNGQATIQKSSNYVQFSLAHYVIRVMHSKQNTPDFIQEILDRPNWKDSN